MSRRAAPVARRRRHRGLARAAEEIIAAVLARRNHDAASLGARRKELMAAPVLTGDLADCTVAAVPRGALTTRIKRT